MSAVATAIVGGAVIGGLIASNSAKKAADAQTDAADQATQLQWDMYNQNRDDLAPWRNTGEWALGTTATPAAENVKDLENQRNQLTQILKGTPNQVVVGYTPVVERPGESYRDRTDDLSLREPQPRYETQYMPPENAADIQKQIDLLDKQIAAGGAEVPGTGLQGMIERGPGEFTESPGYQFTLDEGIKAQGNALSSMGRNRSGSHIKSATQYAEGLASTEYDNFLNRWYQSLTPYQSLAGVGQTSAGQTAALGANAANQMGQNTLYGGQAQAAGNINQANVLTGAIQGGANQLLYLNQMRNYQPNAPSMSGAGYPPVNSYFAQPT